MRSFAVQQAILLLLGLLFAFASLFYIRNLEHDSEIAKLKSDISLAIERKSEKLRTWKSLELLEAVDQEVKSLKSTYPIYDFIFVPKSELPEKLKKNEIQIPTKEDPDLDLYIVVRFEGTGTLFKIINDPNTYFVLLAIFLLILSNIILGTRFFSKRVINPLTHFKEALQNSDKKNAALNKPDSGNGEISDFIDDIIRITNENSKLQTERDALQTHAALGLQASQVNHDIRSPLAALNMITMQLKGVTEEQRLLIRNSVARINDIANSLLQKSKSSRSNLGKEKMGLNVFSIELLPALVDGLISEKRIQFREFVEVEIECDIENSYGTFVNIDSVEIKRVLSNLINNSVEAFSDNRGKIEVSVIPNSNTASIIIKDNGRGIPEHVLPRLGERGVSHGKNNNSSGGSGLGLYHAKTTIESMSGTLAIQSKLGVGTEINITLNKVEPPKWFLKHLILPRNAFIVSIDDDLSIHGVWQERFKTIDFKKCANKHITFTSGLDFRDWYIHTMKDTVSEKSPLFLFDFELLNQPQTGLDIIEDLAIGPFSILVTSRYEEVLIQKRCEALGVKLIPKTMASVVPLSLEKPRLKFDACLIDDDPLVRMTWIMAAKESKINFEAFHSREAFLEKAEIFDRSTPIYIDMNLADDVKGTDVAVDLSELGFANLYLATGYEIDSIRSIPKCIQQVCGKDPVFFNT